MTLEDSVLRHRLAVLQRAAALGNVSQACREFGISRALFYRWRKRFTRYGHDGLRPRPTRPSRWPRQAMPALEHQVVAYALLWPTHGPARIAAHLRQPRWGGWQVSASGAYAILCRHGLRTRWERLTRLEVHSAVTGGCSRSAPADEPFSRGGRPARGSSLHRPALLQSGAAPPGLSAQGPDPGNGIQNSGGVSKCKHLVRA